MKSIILTIVLLAIPSVCFPETIILKSGNKIEGKIIERTDKYIKIDFEGVPLTYFPEDIESIVETSKTEISTISKTESVGTGCYVNEKYGFSINEPLGWQKQENVRLHTGNPALVFYSKSSSYPVIGITEDSILPIPDVKNVMDFTRKMMDVLKRQGAYIIEGPEDKTLDNMPATMTIFTFPAKVRSEEVDTIWWQVLKDNTVLTFNFMDTKSGFNENKLVFEEMLRSLKFSKPAIQLTPPGYSKEDAEIDLKKAIELAAKGNFRESILLHEKAAIHLPVRAYQSLAFIYFNLRRYDEAMQYLQKVLEVKPDDSWAYYHIGTTYAFQGRIKESIGPLKKSITYNNAEPELLIRAYYNLGISYKQLRNYQDAKSNFEEALKLSDAQGNTSFSSEIRKRINELQGAGS